MVTTDRPPPHAPHIDRIPRGARFVSALPHCSRARFRDRQYVVPAGALPRHRAPPPPSGFVRSPERAHHEDRCSSILARARCARHARMTGNRGIKKSTRTRTPSTYTCGAVALLALSPPPRAARADLSSRKMSRDGWAVAAFAAGAAALLIAGHYASSGTDAAASAPGDGRFSYCPFSALREHAQLTPRRGVRRRRGKKKKKTTPRDHRTALPHVLWTQLGTRVRPSPSRSARWTTCPSFPAMATTATDRAAACLSRASRCPPRTSPRAPRSCTPRQPTSRNA